MSISVVQMETAVVGNATRFYVMAVTPMQLYSFTGIGSFEVSIIAQFHQLQVSKTYAYIECNGAIQIEFS